MNERYLFKAKRIDNGKWIIGFITFHKTGKAFIKPIFGDERSSEEVDQSTICQCTGMRDKNSKLIWENDIVKYDCGETRIDFIEYQPPIFTYSKSIRWNLQQDEVIGNIFDNPELLESGK